MSTAVSTHTGAGPLSLMSCVRESSPPQDVETDYENEKNVREQKKKTFWSRLFKKRKNNKVADDATSSPIEVIELPKESQRSRSTSELSETEEPTRRRNGTPMHPGLSVSHDSVFHSPHSGSEIELEGAQSSSSLSIHHQLHTDRLQTELTERLRLRRGRGDTSEDDEGLPRSPCNSPTATDKTAIKDNPKSHSTCSENSLLSVGSSEMDEDSFGQQSVHSSKLSLDDKYIGDGDFDLDIGLKNSSAPLNHSGARHKASVKPQRRYGAPRKKRLSGSVLPTTPEVNEDATIRSMTPEVHSTKAAPGTDTAKLNRSRSNAGSKYQDEFATLGEEDENKDNKKTENFFGRIFPRRSGKKKKSKEEKVVSVAETVTSVQVEKVEKRENLIIKPIPVPRTGAAARQRIQPSDIPASPELGKDSPDKSNPASPLHIELENHLQQRLASLSTSPKSPLIRTPPTSPKHQRSPLISPPKSPLTYPKVPLKSYLIEKNKHTRNEEVRSKVIITGLSPFQQRVANNNEDEDDNDGFKSLSDLPSDVSIKPTKLVAKSHSFKITNNTNTTENKTTFAALASRSSHEIQNFKTTVVETKEKEIKKTISLDSIKNLEDAEKIQLPPKPLPRISPEILKINRSNSKEEEILKINRSNSKEFSENAEILKINRSNSREYPENAEILKINRSNSKEYPENAEILKINRSNSREYPEILKINRQNSRDIPEKNEIGEKINRRNSKESPEKGGESAEIFKMNRSNSREFPEKNPENVEILKVNPEASPKDVKMPEISENSEQMAKIETKEFTNNTINIEETEFSSNTEFSSKTEIREASSPQEFKDFLNGITISGPRHKAIVSVTNHETETEIKHTEMKEQQITKIQLKQDTVPEFMNIQLHKVEKPQNNNIVLTAGFEKPEDDKIETLETEEVQRKFSKDDIEIVEIDEEKKHVTTALVTITTMTPPVPTRIYKKNDHQVRKSLISVNNSDKPVLKTKSNSLDMVEKIDEKMDDLKTKSVNDLTESEPTVPMRRKSMVKQKQEDEPELMKVFARRSLKLKDNESEALSQQVVKMMEESTPSQDVKSRDSDKENQLDSPSEERKKIVPKAKEPLIETTPEVTLRKPINNNNKYYQRTVSLNNTKTDFEKIQKQNSFADRPKTDHWINFRTTVENSETKICQDEILISEKTLIEDDFCTKPKNFNQRKAEWEKRAQEASRKTTP